MVATDRPLAIAPAMNRLMWSNAATQSNVATLRQRGVHVFGPGAGSQACGETGDGRMLEPVEIRAAVAQLFAQGPLAGLNAVVTAGPTREPIDPVRVITNRSSGKQGYAVAQALNALGASVTLVSGPTALAVPAGVRRVDIETAQDMLDASLSAAAGADLFVGTAAVADYRPAQIETQKIKKKDAEMSLPLERTTDVLKAVRERFPKLFMVGFAAETEKLAEHAQGKLTNKKLDLIAANLVGGGRAFDQEDNALHLFWPGGEQALAPASKAVLARELAQVIAARFRARLEA